VRIKARGVGWVAQGGRVRVSALEEGGRLGRRGGGDVAGVRGGVAESV